MGSKEIFALRKQGRSAEALEMARAEFETNSADVWFLRAYAWTIYDPVKKLIEAHEAKPLSLTALSAQLSPYMREFSRMAEALRGDSAFSQMIRLAGKAAKDWDEFLQFARWAGVDDFSVDDKAPFLNEKGKTIDSLQKRFTRAICRATVAQSTDPHVDQELIQWGLGILDQALLDEPSDQWLNFYQSKLHLARGEADLAIKRLALVLRRQARAAWPWALLGDILEPTRPEDSLTCYTYATQLAREEQEVAKIRIHLAQRLSLVGRYNEAAQQASLALKYREQHNFKVPQGLAQLVASDWYQQAVANNSLQQLPKAEVAARALLRELDQQTLTYTQGVIDHINAEKALSYVATGATTGFGLLHRKFPQVASLAPGTFVEVGCAAGQGALLDCRPSAIETIPGLCETLSGKLERRDGKDFAFIQAKPDDIFVPPSLATQFATDQQFDVTCLAIRRTNNRDGKTGWRAVKIIEYEGGSPSATV
jgi:tetratricopeptide (TPR) repeat protein